MDTTSSISVTAHLRPFLKNSLDHDEQSVYSQTRADGLGISPIGKLILAVTPIAILLVIYCFHRVELWVSL